MIYGFFFKNHDVRLPKVLIACALVCFVINLGLDTVWLSILQGQAYLAILPARVIKAAIAYVLQVTLIPIVYHGVVKHIPALRAQSEA